MMKVGHDEIYKSNQINQYNSSEPFTQISPKIKQVGNWHPSQKYIDNDTSMLLIQHCLTKLINCPLLINRE